MLLVVGCSANADYLPARSVVYPVAIEFVKTPGAGGFSSAVLVQENLYVSSAHIVPEDKSTPVQLFVNTRAGRKLAKIVKIDRENDLVLLRADTKCPCALLDTEVPKLDQPVVLVGYPWGSDVKMQLATDGRFQGTNEDNLFVTSAPAAPGNSGGGLFREQNGNLVLTGIVRAIHGGHEQSGFTHWISYIVPISTVKKFLAAP